MRSKILEKELLVAEDVYQMAEVIERSHKETLQFENIRFQKPGMGEIQAESKEELSLQEGTNTQHKEANAVRSKPKNFRGNRGSFQLSGMYAYRGLGNRRRTCFSCGEYGHFVATCPYSSGGAGTDAMANPYPQQVSGRGGYPRAGHGHGSPLRSNYLRGNFQNARVIKSQSALSTVGDGTILKDTSKQVFLNGREFTALIDTGASLNYLTVGVAELLKVKLDPTEISEVSMADTSTSLTLGTLNLHVELKGIPNSGFKNFTLFEAARRKFCSDCHLARPIMQ